MTWQQNWFWRSSRPFCRWRTTPIKSTLLINFVGGDHRHAGSRVANHLRICYLRTIIAAPKPNHIVCPRLVMLLPLPLPNSCPDLATHLQHCRTQAQFNYMLPTSLATAQALIVIVILSPSDGDQITLLTNAAYLSNFKYTHGIILQAKVAASSTLLSYPHIKPLASLPSSLSSPTSVFRWDPLHRPSPLYFDCFSTTFSISILHTVTSRVLLPRRSHHRLLMEAHCCLLIEAHCCLFRESSPSPA